MHLGSVTPQINIEFVGIFNQAFWWVHFFHCGVEIFGGGPALPLPVATDYSNFFLANCDNQFPEQYIYIRVHATVSRNKSVVLLIVNSSTDDGPTAAWRQRRPLKQSRNAIAAEWAFLTESQALFIVITILFDSNTPKSLTELPETKDLLLKFCWFSS